MDSKEAGKRLEVLNNYTKSQPNLHMNITQEKKEYAEVKERSKKTKDKVISKYKEIPKTIWLNSIKKRLPINEITQQMMEIEEEFGTYLYNND